MKIFKNSYSTFDTVAEAVASGMAVGQKFKIYGYYTRDDGYKTKGEVVAESGQLIDNGKYHLMASGNVLDIYITGRINAITWGVDSSIPDISIQWNKMIDFIETKAKSEGFPRDLKLNAKKYTSLSTLNIPKPQAVQQMFWELSAYGAEIKTTEPITLLERRPVDQTEAMNIISGLTPIIKGIKLVGSSTSTAGLFLGATYNHVVKDVTISGFQTGVISSFALMGLHDNIRFGSCAVDNIVLTSGASSSVEYGWSGGTLSASASNLATITNCRVYGVLGAKSHYKILASDSVLLENIVSEGSDPEYGIYYDYQSATTVKMIHMKGLHFESVGGGKIADIYVNGAGVIDIDGIYRQYGNPLIDLNGVAPNLRMYNVSWVGGLPAPSFLNSKGTISGYSIYLGQEMRAVAENPTYFAPNLAAKVIDSELKTGASAIYIEPDKSRSSIHNQFVTLVGGDFRFIPDNERILGGYYYGSNNIARPKMIAVGDYGINFANSALNKNENGIYFDSANNRWVLGSTGSPWPYTPFMYWDKTDKTIAMPWHGSNKAIISIGYDGVLKSNLPQVKPDIPSDVSASPTQAEIQAILDYAKTIDSKLQALELFRQKDSVGSLLFVNASSGWSVDGVFEFIQEDELSIGGVGLRLEVTISGGSVVSLTSILDGGSFFKLNEEPTLRIKDNAESTNGTDTIKIRVGSLN